ncbi:MAG: inorganic triphosphatase, partial [Rhodospirillales bacterium]|nr:inorganic triphosphatase [Rhodospirillales bacterium]
MPQEMRMPAREIELKLEVDATGFERLKDHPRLRDGAGTPETRPLRTVYHDTADAALWQAGLIARMRDLGDRRLLGIKSRSRAGGLMDRREHEEEIAGETIDIKHLRHTPLRDLLDAAAIDGPLQPLFATEIHRTAWYLPVPQGRIEIALDQGEIVCGDRREAIREVELELQGGSAAELFHLALALQADIPRLRILTRSKSDRGYALVHAAEPAGRKAEPTDLTPDMTVEAAVEAIARSCLGHFLANEPILRVSRHPEAVHQMRVALRRLRTAFALFKPLLHTAEGEALRTEMRWLLGDLGAARDMDVFLAEVIDPAAEALPD